MRVLLVGCGALGSAIAKGLAGMPGVTTRLFDTDAARADALGATVGAPRVATIQEGLTEAELVIEAASQGALRAVAPMVLSRGLPLVALSVGALVDQAFLDDVAALAREHGGRLHVPSGAIGGLDVIRAAMEGGLEEVTLTTAKPPAGFGLSGLAAAKVLYEGPAAEAVAQFPKNVNVAAALSLAGIGFARTRVRIVADPALTVNTHTVTARGNFGLLELRVENRPSPDNPASSHLASLAALALVRRLISPITVGT